MVSAGEELSSDVQGNAGELLEPLCQSVIESATVFPLPTWVGGCVRHSLLGKITPILPEAILRERRKAVSY